LTYPTYQARRPLKPINIRNIVKIIPPSRLTGEKQALNLNYPTYAAEIERSIKMAGLNRVQLIGRLGKDPEERFTSTGKKYCIFSLAVNQKRKSAEGELKEYTEWFNIEAWGRLGEICQEYLTKGRLVYLEGRLHTERYEHEGEARYFTKVNINNMQMLDRREEEDVAVDEILEE
jgi:single-strand DNA-binding protein